MTLRSLIERQMLNEWIRDLGDSGRRLRYFQVESPRGALGAGASR